MAMEMVPKDDGVGDNGEGKSPKAEDESSHGDSLVVKKMPSGDGVGISVSTVEGDISDGSLAKVISKISFSDVVKDGFYLWGMRLSFR